MDAIKKDLLLYKYCKIDFDFKLLFDDIITDKFNLEDIKNNYYSIEDDGRSVNFNGKIYDNLYRNKSKKNTKYLNCCNELKKYYIKRSCESLICLDCFKKYLKQAVGYLHNFLQCHDNYSDCKWNCPGKFSLLINDNVK